MAFLLLLGLLLHFEAENHTSGENVIIFAWNLIYSKSVALHIKNNFKIQAVYDNVFDQKNYSKRLSLRRRSKS
ncbi:MAG: hypothetical protein RR731_01965 [Oscillospiraceae bacterium]